MNAVVVAVVLMLALSVARVNVVLSLVVGAFVGGLVGGLPLADVKSLQGEIITQGVMTHFQNGLSSGAKIALAYAMLGAFAMAIAHSGLPQQLAGWVIRHMDQKQSKDMIPSRINWLKWSLILLILMMIMMVF